MRVVTSGFRYLDIDAYGGMVAYAELLNLQGSPAIAATTAPLNESITPSIRSWPVQIDRSYTANKDDLYVIIDLSEPKIFDTFVDPTRVVEVIDHHLDCQEYWRSQTKVKAQIEFVGAACTLIYERWRDSGMIDKISQTSARLLIGGILDNTLNFKAAITDSRDRAAYDDLVKYADLPGDWPPSYFLECQQVIEGDVVSALRNDTKHVQYPGLEPEVSVAQLVVWDARFALDQLALVTSATPTDQEWFINIASISEGKNYIVCEDIAVQKYLSTILDVNFDGKIGVTNRLWLRKEIMKSAMEGIRSTTGRT